MDKNSLVKKKNTAGKKGKKKWAQKLDATEMVSEIEKQHDKKRAKEQIDKAQNIGFEIDTGVNDDGQRKPLAKDRFKKRNFELDMSKKLLRRIEKKAKTMNKLKEKQQNQKNQQVSKDGEQEESDSELWENEDSKKQKLIKNEINIKSVILPDDGQSYNPSAKSHNEHNAKIINEEMIKDNMVGEFKQSIKTQRAVEEAKERLKKRKLTKSQKNNLEILIANNKKQEKHINHQFLNLKRIKQEINQETQQKLDKKQKLQEFQDLEDEKQKQSGVVSKGKAKKISNKKYQMNREIVLEEEIPENLRQIQQGSGSLVRQQFDSAFRKGLIETRGHKSQIVRKGKVKPRKNYGAAREMTEEDAWMDERVESKPKQASLEVNN